MLAAIIIALRYTEIGIKKRRTRAHYMVFFEAHQHRFIQRSSRLPRYGVASSSQGYTSSPGTLFSGGKMSAGNGAGAAGMGRGELHSPI